MTKVGPLTREEHEARRDGIGSSDAPIVLGLSPWKTPIDLWMEKVGMTEAEISEASWQRWGKLLEKAVIDELEERSGIRFRRAKAIGRVRHPELGWMTASPDGWNKRRKIVVEAKTSRSSKGWGEPGTSEIPTHYAAQAVHLAVVTGAERVLVPVLIGGSDYREYELVPTDEQREALVEAEREFWNLVETETPPDEISSAYVRAAFPADDGTEKVATPDEVRLVDFYRIHRIGRELAEKSEAEAAAKIQAAIGEATRLVGPGFRISFARTRDAERTDWKLLAGSYRRALEKIDEEVRAGSDPFAFVPTPTDLDALASLYTETRPGSRVFRPTFFEEEGENGNG